MPAGDKPPPYGDTIIRFSASPRSRIRFMWRIHASSSPVEVKCLVDTGTMFTCLFGPPDGLPLLGAVSLEQFALAVDPLVRALVPTRVPMA